MSGLCNYANRPVALILHYARCRPLAHGVILTAVLGAVCCSIGTQYGVKFLVDQLSNSHGAGAGVWTAFWLLGGFIAADNLLWRAASAIANFAFVEVTGDVRRDLFRHLIGHSSGYFAAFLPGTLTSRISATSNAIFTTENMFMWNVLPPCVATVAAIVLVIAISGPMALCLAAAASIMVGILFRLAAGGSKLQHDFATRAAEVDGEMADVIGNMQLVRSFGGHRREHSRFDRVLRSEMAARQRSLVYLEKLRVFHAVVTAVLTLGLLAWAIALWRRGSVTTGDVVLACTLGISVLHATRDLAVALVDVTQHLTRLSEAIATVLIPHAQSDRADAVALVSCGAHVIVDHVSFHYPDGRQVFRDLCLNIAPGERVGVVGPSGAGKSTLFGLIQRLYDVQRGRIIIDGQDIAHVTLESLRSTLGIVGQDISLFQRSVLDNIRYGRQDASDDDVLEAANAAGCDFVDELPDRFLTMVGDRGIMLSGGQRQRIAIARAFLKDAPLLLLDEATSSLDGDSENAFRDALRRLMGGRTVIAIAHRLSALQDFDRIVVLQAGAVVQDGAPQLLMRSDGHYGRLVRREMARFKDSAAA